MLSSRDLVDQRPVSLANTKLITTKSCSLALSELGFNAFNSGEVAQFVLALLDNQLQ